MTTGKQRARSDLAKLQRREHILKTALELWHTRTFATFTMAEVAAQSSLAKGTLYLYFETKEELLLALLDAQLDAWFTTLDARLAGGPYDVAQAAELIAATTERQPALARLLPIAASILEHNIPLDSARAYKARLLSRSAHSAALLERQLAFLAPGDGIWLLLQIYALIVGLGQMADPAPVVCTVLDDPQMAPLRVDFVRAFRRAITTLLTGLHHQPDDVTGPSTRSAP